MHGFKEFVVENDDEKYDREKHIKKLDKTGKSLINHLNRTNSRKSGRTFELIRRYDDLKDHMINQDHEGWKKYSKDRDFDPSHRGRDFLA